MKEVNIVRTMKQVHDFATKWIDKFRDQKINYIELVDHYMADDCSVLGFQMDCGHAFSEKYGSAASRYDGLNKIIEDVTDIDLLGSAIYSQWRYFNHWAYDASAILENENRSWFILALSRLAILSGEKPFVFTGQLQKIHLVSKRICYSLCPGPDEEVEQHITINSEGQVWFSAYVFGQVCNNRRHEKSRTQNLKLTKDCADKIFSAFTAYFSEGYDEIYATDIGDWDMELTNTEGKIYKFRGSLCSDFEVNETDLSDLLRNSLNMPDLYAFDGNSKPDLVKRIEIRYHRITKIKPKVPVSETIEYAVWDYTESMVIDSDHDTIEHIQNIGTGCSVTRTYKVEDGVRSLLEDLDVNTLFGHIEGNPEDVFVDPLESRDYSIRVLTQRGRETVVQGTYDKKGLPDGWAEFINSVFEFLTFYGWGEIMNPSVYGKVRRTSRDIIYCSVTFEDGYKNYYYIAEDDSIEVGDFVLVPAGADNHEAIVNVVKKEYFPEDGVPLPLDKTKHIIRKCTDDDFDSMD
ncbi:hypothetical protein B5F13_08830 [Drancourtella sp. An177]|nr:hypothetical protein B5F13_08830 [Drancourtella sp. An177]